MGPLRYVNSIAEVFGAKFSKDAQAYLRSSCSDDNAPNLEFTFGEAKIVMYQVDLLAEFEVRK